MSRARSRQEVTQATPPVAGGATGPRRAQRCRRAALSASPLSWPSLLGWPGPLGWLGLSLLLVACPSSGGSSNKRPSVSIESPSDRAFFPSGIEVTLSASAADEDGSVRSVSFYLDGVLLGEDSSAPFEFEWTSAAPGEYLLEAVARDDSGARRRDELTFFVGRTLRVPEDHASVQAALDAALENDFVRVGPGTWVENLEWTDKRIALVSEYYFSADEGDIEATVLDGDGDTVIHIERAQRGGQVTGLTIQNGSDGLLVSAYIDVLHCRVLDCGDGLDYEPDAAFGGTGNLIGGGRVAACLFAGNSDDGIDLDYSVEAVIEGNRIVDNGDDGIEFRLHDYTGATLCVLIRDNQIIGNQEDGIQLIDYPSDSDRLIRIERNLIADSAMAGVGFMDSADSNEDYRAAQIPEPVYLIGNTITGNEYGITGGGNAVALNNILLGTTNSALLGMNSLSHAAYNLFWSNGHDHDDSLVDELSTIYADPELDGDYRLSPGSQAIDAGVASFSWRGAQVLALSADDYLGAAPDLGAFELEQ